MKTSYRAADAAPHPDFISVPAYAQGPRRASITRTAHGIAHITANDFESLGYAQGQVVRADNATTLLDCVERVRGERSARYGRHDKSGDNANLYSDIGYRALGYTNAAEAALARMSSHANALIDGFVEGFNHALPPSSGSLTAPQQRYLTRTDLACLLLALADEASGQRFIMALALAKPPCDTQEPNTSLTTVTDAFDLPLDIGSNAWAIGAERAVGAQAILLANPHLPLSGALRLYQVHLRIPGAFDVAGVSILGCLSVNMGFNRHVAWTHTVSSAERFVLYQVPLVPEAKTVQRWQGGTRPLQCKQISIDILGEALAYRHDLWSSIHGPVLHIPGHAEWTTQELVCLGNANADNPDVLDHWLAIGAAQSLDDLEHSFSRWRGTSWVNLLAVDAHGNTLYLDGSTIPSLPEAALSALQGEGLIADTRRRLGLVVLPGDKAAFACRAPCALPARQRPRRRTTDWIANFNNSYERVDWNNPLPAALPLFGKCGVPLSARARRGYQLTLEHQGRIDATTLERWACDQRVMLADLLLDELKDRKIVSRQADLSHIESDPHNAADAPVNLHAAIAILHQWNRHDELDAVGAPLFREFAQAYFGAGEEFATPFDANDPLRTPTGLSPARQSIDPALAALDTAVRQLRRQGFSAEASLRDMQFHRREDGSCRAVGGGPNLTGVLDVQQIGAETPAERLAQFQRGRKPMPSGLSTEGYPVNFGTCWLASIRFLDGIPYARSVLPYGQASDPTSIWYEDRHDDIIADALCFFPFLPEDVQRFSLAHTDLCVPRTLEPDHSPSQEYTMEDRIAVARTDTNGIPAHRHTIDIREDDLAGEPTRRLLELHLKGMQADSPADSVFALDLSGLQKPEITVWTAWRGDDIAGVCALKMLGADSAELKSMRTHPDHLRSGVAALLLEHVVTVASNRGVRRLSLETGSGTSFEPALALYRKRGFTNGPVFSDYVETGFNQFLHLTL